MFLFSAKINERKKEKKVDVSFHFYLFFEPQLRMFIKPYERLYKTLVGLFFVRKHDVSPDKRQSSTSLFIVPSVSLNYKSTCI